MNKTNSAKVRAIDWGRRRFRLATGHRCRLDAWTRITSRPSGCGSPCLPLCAAITTTRPRPKPRMRTLIGVFVDWRICKKHERPEQTGFRAAVAARWHLRQLLNAELEPKCRRVSPRAWARSVEQRLPPCFSNRPCFGLIFDPTPVALIGPVVPSIKIESVRQKESTKGKLPCSTPSAFF